MSAAARWETPPPVPTLVGDPVHVWRAGLDRPPADVAQLWAYLSPDERTRAERFRFDHDRRRFIVARGTLRALLSRYVGEEPAGLQFSYGPNGKPALVAETGGTSVRFNQSHSHDLALYAVAREREVGVDVERVRPLADLEPLAQRCLSGEEWATFCSLPADRRLAAFFTCWTRKEACLKAWGHGLAVPLETIEVTFSPGLPARLLRVGGDVADAAGWSLCELPPIPDYATALAVEGSDWRLHCWHWPDGNPR